MTTPNQGPVADPKASGLEVQGGLLTRNTLLNLLGLGLPLVVALVSVPFVIRGLGTARYGILALVWVILNAFVIFDMGLGGAVTKFVAEALGKDRQETLPRLVWTAAILQAALGVLGGLALAAATPFVVERILNIPGDLLTEARSSFYILALAGPVVLISRSFIGVMEAAQRFDLLNAARAPFMAANPLLQLLGVGLGWGLPGIVALLVVSHGIMVAIQFWMCTWAFPKIKSFPRFGLQELRTLLGFGRWVAVSNFISPILVYFDRFVIGALLTMSAVAYYSAPYGMATQLWIIPTSFAATLYPAFSALHGQGERGRIGALLCRSVKFLLLALGPAVIVGVVYAPQILLLWLGPDFADESAIVLRFLLVGVLANSLAWVPYVFLQGLGRPDITAKLHMVECPLHMLLVWGAVSIGGINGAALAWSLRAAVDALLLFVFASRQASLTPKSFLVERVPQTAWLLICLGACALGIHALAVASWLRLALLIVAVSMMGALAWYYLFNPGDRAQVGMLFRAEGPR